MATDPQLMAAFDFDRRLQNVENVVHEMVDMVGRGVAEAVRDAWHLTLSGPHEPIPSEAPTPAPLPAPVPDLQAQLTALQAENAALRAAQTPEGVDPANPPSASMEVSENPVQTIVAPDTLMPGMPGTVPASDEFSVPRDLATSA